LSALHNVPLRELSLSVKRILLIFQHFNVEKHSLHRKKWIEETYVTARRMPSKLESWLSYTMFLYDNWVCLLKEYSLSISVFKCRTFISGNIGSYSWIEETHAAAMRIPSKLESWVSYTIFPFKNIVSLSKYTVYQSFQAGDTNVSGKTVLYCKIEETHVTAKRIPSKLQFWESVTIFPCEKWMCQPNN
jgi:hypothetical protein